MITLAVARAHRHDGRGLFIVLKGLRLTWFMQVFFSYFKDLYNSVNRHYFL